jgi:mediator of RNA polymerase II transcription subunit 17
LDVEPPPSETIRALDDLAQGMAIAFRLLLSYNHRLNLRRRSKPPPPLNSPKVTPQPLWLVRPITNHVYHQQHLDDLRSVLLKLQSFAKAAGLNVDFLLTPLKNCRNPEIEGVESAVETFLTILETTGRVMFPGGWKLAITMRTMIGPPTFGTGYSVGTTHDGVSAKLMGESRFYSVEELQLYLCWCLERSIANEIRVTGEWRQEAQDNEMVRSIGDKKIRRIRIVVSGQGLAVSWFGSARSDRCVWDGEDHQTSLLDVLRGLL